MRIGIINGPNMNLLGHRNPDIYGDRSFESYFDELESNYPDHVLLYFQSNSEGEIIDQLQLWGFKLDGIVLNPAAYTHTSIAIADTVEAIPCDVIEVHISNVDKRENFRQISYLREYCIRTISGRGLEGYKEAIDHLLKR